MDFNLEEFVQKYDVHPETLGFLKAAAGVKPYYEIGVAAARQAFIARCEVLGGKIDFEGSEQEIFVPCPDVKDGIPVTVYKPKSCDDIKAPSVLVYFHGGGHVVGCRKTSEPVCKILARNSPCIVVNVEYRLAPEHKYPANLDDAKCVVEWVAKNKTAVGGVPESKLGVCGDSAGGYLCTVVSHEAHDLIDFSILVYPVVDLSMQQASVKEFYHGPVLSWKVFDWFLSHYRGPDETHDETSPRVSPVSYKDFSYLPPTLILVAELDPLRDGCYEYYELLKKAGVDVNLKTIKGVPHTFWCFPDYVNIVRADNQDLDQLARMHSCI